MIFLYWFFDAVANGKSSGDAEIVRRIWLAGVIPFLIGIGIIINGLLFVPRRGAKPHEPQIQMPEELTIPPAPPIAKTTNQLAISGGSPINEFSVTEGTTSHLSPKAELDEKAGPIFAPKAPQ
jgi:hypothetical protein